MQNCQRVCVCVCVCVCVSAKWLVGLGGHPLPLPPTPKEARRNERSIHWRVFLVSEKPETGQQ
ncbi:hypothetical protein BDZ91DRAFT_735968 [Kalaharituber pfeilii]|nr:hypothetical protein BDZ91DRAFT_735968 [Kalaharituber pfeilii]